MPSFYRSESPYTVADNSMINEDEIVSAIIIYDPMDDRKILGIKIKGLTYLAPDGKPILTPLFLLFVSVIVGNTFILINHVLWNEMHLWFSAVTMVIVFMFLTIKLGAVYGMTNTNLHGYLSMVINRK